MLNMQDISYYFNKFKQSLQKFFSNLSLEFLFCTIIYANSLVTLTGNIFIWNHMKNYDKENALINEIIWFSTLILTIISGIVTVIIVNYLNNVNNV